MADTVNLFALLQQHAAAHPERSAIATTDLQINYGELPGRIASVAAGLRVQGFESGGMTGVAVLDDVQHMLLTMALMCMGTPHISLWATDANPLLERKADKLQIRQLIHETGQPHGLLAREEITGFELRPASEGVDEATQWLAAHEQSLDAMVCYRSTSGTTGDPKIFGSVLANSLEHASLFASEPGKACVLRTGRCEHDANRLHNVGVLLGGQTLPVLFPFTAERLAPFCEAYGVTEVQAGPLRLVSLLDSEPDEGFKLPPGTRWISGGIRVPGPLRFEVMKRLTTELYVLFATSEAFAISQATPDEHERWPEGVGHPMPGVEVELRDAAGSPVPRGEVGELWVRRQGVPGDGTIEKPGWHCTGDLMSWPEDGPLIFHSRADDMMIMNGINIFPGPIEDALLEHEEVSEALAFPLESRLHGQIPVAAVVLKQGGEVAAATLVKYARDKLGKLAPRKIVILDEIPRTSLGKPRPLELQAAMRAG
ncbi:MAG: class I adenylate-forming enzyme family protein [Pseudomonadota bacterium]